MFLCFVKTENSHKNSFPNVPSTKGRELQSFQIGVFVVRMKSEFGVLNKAV